MEPMTAINEVRVVRVRRGQERHSSMADRRKVLKRIRMKRISHTQS